MLYSTWSALGPITATVLIVRKSRGSVAVAAAAAAAVVVVVVVVVVVSVGAVVSVGLAVEPGVPRSSRVGAASVSAMLVLAVGVGAFLSKTIPSL
jgi:hypothetical protein